MTTINETFRQGAPAGQQLDLADMRRRIKAIFIGSVGNLVEWYDFFAYAAFALYFAAAFFPNTDPVVQQLNAAVLFAVGFLVRPLGGWLFGHLADHYGRRSALMLSVMLMCFGSLMIAVTPTYASIGIAAPIVLGIARIIQGLSLGGEYGTSATYLTEMADERHRGFYSSFQYVTLIGGQLCALVVLLLLQKVFLTNDEIRAWGWRVPFVIGAGLAVIAAVMRRSSGVALSYLKIRDVTTKDEEANGASTYVAVLPAAEILKIGTDGNLRSYIPEHEGKKRNLVHKAIARTITDMPDRFSQLNSGFLVGASKIAVDDKEKIVTLYHPSVNNGAQSQGEIKRYLERCVEQGEEPVDFAVRCEFSIEPDTSVRTTIAVARNTTTKIEGISIAGKHGYFDHLIPSFKKEHPGLELATSETDGEEKYVDTRLLLQVLWAMMPDELVPEHRRSTEARMRAYKNAAYCLQDFVNIVDRRDLDEDDAERFRYFVEMAGEAWREYLRWHAHEEWNDKRLREPLRQVVRGDEGIIKVSDGIIFPILSALSKFVKKRGGFRTTVSGPGGVQRTVDAPRWQIVYPKVFHDEDMLIAARRQLIQCGGRPMLMGRSGGAYEALMTLTEMAERYSQAAAS